MLDIINEVGRYKKIDLHQMSKEEARAEIMHEIFLADNIDSLVLVHGYHGGRVLKNLVRKEFKHERIERIVNLDASTTAYKLKKMK